MKVDFHESRLDGIKIDRIDEFNFGKMYRVKILLWRSRSEYS